MLPSNAAASLFMSVSLRRPRLIAFSIEMGAILGDENYVRSESQPFKGFNVKGRMVTFQVRMDDENSSSEWVMRLEFVFLGKMMRSVEVSIVEM
jgi:hypothetical protein